MLAGVLFIAPAATSSAGEIRQAAQEVGTELSRRVVCAGQSRASVGIWPFDEASIPLSPTSAYRLYAQFLGALMEAGCKTARPWTLYRIVELFCSKGLQLWRPADRR